MQRKKGIPEKLAKIVQDSKRNDKKNKGDKGNADRPDKSSKGGIPSDPREVLAWCV
jgi:hypothetical protein